MSNLALTDNYQSNSAGLVVVGQMDIAVNLEKIGAGGWSQIDASTPFNIISIRSNYNSAGYIPFDKSGAESLLRTGGYRNDDIAWSTNKEAFNNAISWIWGNLESGGVGLVRLQSLSNPVTFVESHGIYYDEENDYEKIGFIVNSQIQSSQVDAVSFNYEYNWERDYYVDGQTTIFCTTSRPDREFRYKIWTYTLGFVGYSTEAGTTSLGAVLSDRWSGSYMGTDYPYYIIEPNSFTSPYWGNIVAFHSSYDFNFGNEYSHEGDIHGDEDYEPEDNDTGGTSKAGGGDGGFDTSSDPSNRVTEDQFTIDAINSGFVTVYMPTQANIQAFSDFLFTGITEDLSIVLKRLISNPLDYVISLNMIHFTPVVGSTESIKFCGIDSGVNAPRVTKQMQIINCGSLDVDEQFCSFMDYSGHSKLKIYLPYCGIFPLDINDVMGGTLSLQYIVDILSGSCVAQLYLTRYRNHVGSANESFINDRLIYEYTGNVFEQVPLSAVDYRGTIQGLMTIASGVTSVAAGQSSGLGAVASGVMNLAPDVQHSGNAATSYGYMGVQKPYIFLERQVQNLPIQFQQREGYTSNIYVSKLNDLTGYTEIDIESFHTEYIKCTSQERDELVRILSGGFII